MNPRLLALSALLALPAAPAAAGMLDQLAGDWQGKGTVRSLSNMPSQAIRCRLSGAGGGATLNVSGSCLVAGLRLPLNGTINQRGSAVTSDVFSGISGVRTERFAGKAGTSRLSFSYAGQDLTTGQPIKGDISVGLGGRGFSISIRRQDPFNGRMFEAGAISFAPR